MRYGNHRNVLLAILMVFCLFSCDSPPPHPSPYYFQGANSFERAHEHTITLLRRIGNLEYRMGILYYEFKYYIPDGKKLIVTMKAELNGEILPEMSGRFHIPPPEDSKKRNEGFIGIKYYDPPFQLKKPIGARWDYTFSGPGAESSNYGFISPFELSAMSGFGFSTPGVSQRGLEVDREYEVWNFDLRLHNKPGNKPPYFSLSMSICIAPFDGGNTRYYKVVWEKL